MGHDDVHGAHVLLENGHGQVDFSSKILDWPFEIYLTFKNITPEAAAITMQGFSPYD